MKSRRTLRSASQASTSLGGMPEPTRKRPSAGDWNEAGGRPADCHRASPRMTSATPGTKRPAGASRVTRGSPAGVPGASEATSARLTRLGRSSSRNSSQGTRRRGLRAMERARLRSRCQSSHGSAVQAGGREGGVSERTPIAVTIPVRATLEEGQHGDLVRAHTVFDACRARAWAGPVDQAGAPASSASVAAGTVPTLDYPEKLIAKLTYYVMHVDPTDDSGATASQAD